MASEKRLIDVMDTVTKISKKVQPLLRIGGSTRELYDTILGCLADAPTVDAVEVPPIKVGDTAYFIIHRKIYKAEVYFVRWEHHKRYGIHSEISANVGQYSSVGASFDDFGKTVFLTEEEAETALAKMDGGNENGY